MVSRFLNSVRARKVRLTALLIAMILLPRTDFAYSVQTHEQLIDLAWKPSIVPLLVERYPGLTDAQLREAHAYAYGGSAIQDIGYYPFGKILFSDLTHYVRTGDFVGNLLRDARNANELAFAIGAMTHFVGDTYGHKLAVNPSVALEFPDLRAKYGNSVTYDEDPHAHVRVEFAFDINEISKHRFAPSRYLERVGIKVAARLLASAFHYTYGLNLDIVLGSRRQKVSFGSYKFAVRRFLPRIAYAETVLHGRRMPPDNNDADFQLFEAALSQSEIENSWDQYHRRAGVGTYLLAGLIFVLPPIGPLADLKIRGPDPTTEPDYVRSVNVTIDQVRRTLLDMRSNGPVVQDFPDRDLDTGFATTPGSYRLADETYAKLLHLITRPGAGKMPGGLLTDVKAFYADPSGPNTMRRNAKAWAKVQADLAVLTTVSPIQAN